MIFYIECMQRTKLFIICAPKLWWSKKIHLLCLGSLGFFHFLIPFDTCISIQNTAVFVVFMFILSWVVIGESAKCKSDMEQYIHAKNLLFLVFRLNHPNLLVQDLVLSSLIIISARQYCPVPSTVMAPSTKYFITCLTIPCQTKPQNRIGFRILFLLFDLQKRIINEWILQSILQ